ncbi:hypothetical protein LEM8419_01038 [Neolewinella maritima]|uniref:Potassium-transporting ATPase subunit F n=1 Tax=Neolewinella maritima TaxID=1383882 RepID=A0ABN8F5I5_9BACT|nr:hypothetical protein LEM8419_01038 [Neolewinella maritima]
MSDLGVAVLFLFVAASFFGVFYLLARFLIKQGRK